MAAPAAPPTPAPLPAWRRTLGQAFPWLTRLLLLAIVVQVFLAGAGVFADRAWFAHHISFVHWFEALPLLMLLCAWAGRLGRMPLLASAGLFLLIGLQYAFAQAGGLVAALHAVNALAIFGLALHLAHGRPARRTAA